MDPHLYLELLGRQLAHELTAHETIRDFVGSNSDLIGKYAEASVRSFIARVVSPLKVSTGTIIYEGNIKTKLPQLDVIVWSPAPVPAVFENGDFAIVPRGSAHGFLEIKSSSYSSGAIEEIAERLQYHDELIQPRWDGYFGALGVVCVETGSSKKLRGLVEQKRAVTLLRQDGDSLVANPDGIWTLVNRLTDLRLRAKATEGQWQINFPLLDPNKPLPKPAEN
jgi:hypothetical protein